MEFSLDERTATLSVGEFAGFSLGPRESGGGGAHGLWRAQLGTHWHGELRSRAAAEHAGAAEFEIPIAGRIVHEGWTLGFSGRIDQIIRHSAGMTLREIKTVTRELPADEAELRRDYPEYFVQIATYAALARLGLLESRAPAEAALPGVPVPGAPVAVGAIAAELVFIETASGLAQTVGLTAADDRLFQVQLARVAEFLDLRLRARERLRRLRYRPPFERPRPGQETTRAELTAVFAGRPIVFFEAPTGFGKTGVLLEFALGELRSGRFDRAIYLTSKSTGQLQVVRTLADMTAGADSDGSGGAADTPVAAWHVRNKAEHCINSTFHCVREVCGHIAGTAERWPASGLARFYLDEKHARDLETLRAAGRHARICPYEITRTALAFNDVWIGDYNYVFAPRNRGLFFDQPGFTPERTLLLIDEAHNLPPRVADAFSHGFSAADAFAVREDLHRIRPLATLVNAWDHWCHALHQLRRCDALRPGDEDDLRHLLGELGRIIPTIPLDLAELGPRTADLLWQIPSLADDLEHDELPRLWWCPRDGELLLTCLDAASVIGATLRQFGGAVLASATLTPVDGFAAACGLVETGDRKPDTRLRGVPATGLLTGADEARPVGSGLRFPVSGIEKLGTLTKRDTKRLFRQLSTGADLLRVEEERDAASPALLRAQAPWRDGAYQVAFDNRVDTTFQHRSLHFAATAGTIARLQAAAGAGGSTACFFPSYGYAEAILRELMTIAPGLTPAMQPRLRDLAAQTAWVEQALAAGQPLFLVLGSSFAESIDALGGRVSHAMVVGPALPEVNPVQRARLAIAAEQNLSRDEAFRRVYQVPGMTKVNQALGRLVRAPGHRARILLHCRRFAEPGYLHLLAPEYQSGTRIGSDADLEAWLQP